MHIAIVAFGLVLTFASTGAALAIDIHSPYVKPLRPAAPSVGGHNYRLDTPQKRYGPAQIANPPMRAPDVGPSINHMQWCQNRYRSYRASDNSYQPLNGGRRSCASLFQP